MILVLPRRYLIAKTALIIAKSMMFVRRHREAPGFLGPKTPGRQLGGQAPRKLRGNKMGVRGSKTLPGGPVDEIYEIIRKNNKNV